ncbi:hypothetical protein AB0F72_08870 [Actinoplanes sp. NPDC023936]|uniref:hypothetical protein n=1 Tax=Actinoplanes sp. NPDC023936 TaxID=3154910 RepID=UPI0033DD8102
MAYADDVQRVLHPEHIRELVEQAYTYFTEANRLTEEAARRDRDNGRALEERTRRIAEVHQRGWDQVARAINDGFRDVAQAIRDSNR